MTMTTWKIMQKMMWEKMKIQKMNMNKLRMNKMMRATKIMKKIMIIIELKNYKLYDRIVPNDLGHNKK